MRKYILFFIIYILSFVTIQAQDAVHPEQHELILLKNHWLNSNNASGLSLLEVPVHGNSELGYQDRGGDYHRAQEGNRLNGLRFFSERYDKMSKNWLVWGSFEFQMNREYDRAWSNVYNTYNSSPYIFGDSIKGNYDQQFFDLHAKLSRKIGNRWAVGVGIDYYAGDMSRLRDARTRTYIANYAAIPSVTFRLSSKQVLGLTSGIRFEKEKMPGTTTVQIDPKINYYFFLGNENANAVIDGYNGFDRQYINLDYSIGLQHSLMSENFDWFNALEFISKKQEIFGNERESPGSYNAKKYSFQSNANIKSSIKLLNISLSGFYNTGSANEYLQELVEDRDTATGVVSKEWVTLYSYNNRYVTNSYHANLNISLRNLLKNANDYSWIAGIDAQFDGFSNKYYLPNSVFENQLLRLGGSAGIRVFNKKDYRITLHARGGYGFGLKNNLQLNSISTTIPANGSSLFEKATYKVANEIMLPDMEYYKQKVVDYRFDARYSFPMNFKKTKLVGLAKIFYGNQISDSRGSWMLLGVSVGLITL